MEKSLFFKKKKKWHTVTRPRHLGRLRTQAYQLPRRFAADAARVRLRRAGRVEPEILDPRLVGLLGVDGVGAFSGWFGSCAGVDVGVGAGVGGGDGRGGGGGGR